MQAKNNLVSFIGLGAGEVAAPLYEYLKTHPRICTPVKETRFFSNTKIHNKGIAWYEKQFGDCEVGTKYGELAGNYLRSLSTADFIARIYPDARLFAVVENPLVNVRVYYVLARRQREIPPDMSLALFIKQNPDILTRAKYGRQLTQYFGYYSPNDLLVLIADDVIEEPLKSVRKVFEHIDVDTSFVPLALKHLSLNDEEEERKVGLIKKGFKYVRKIFVKFYTKLAHIIKPPVAKEEIASVLAKKIPLSPELEKFLKDYYRKDVQVLSSLLHRDLNAEWDI